MARLDNLYKVTVQSGKKQHIAFYKYKATVKKAVTGARQLAKKHKLKSFKIMVRTPVKSGRKK